MYIHIHLLVLTVVVYHVLSLPVLMGANLLVKNNEGLTAHSLAFNNNHVRIVTLIHILNLMQEEGEGV